MYLHDTRHATWTCEGRLHLIKSALPGTQGISFGWFICLVLGMKIEKKPFSILHLSLMECQVRLRVAGGSPLPGGDILRAVWSKYCPTWLITLYWARNPAPQGEHARQAPSCKQKRHSDDDDDNRDHNLPRGKAPFHKTSQTCCF